MKSLEKRQKLLFVARLLWQTAVIPGRVAEDKASFSDAPSSEFESLSDYKYGFFTLMQRGSSKLGAPRPCEFE